MTEHTCSEAHFCHTDIYHSYLVKIFSILSVTFNDNTKYNSVVEESFL